MNRAAATRSTNLEAKLKFDIGRYDFASSASSVGFLSRGKTIADFCVSGRPPDCNDALQIAHRTGARILDARFTSQVGAGSSEQCLAGDRDSSRTTSSTLTGSKLENGMATGRVVITGGGALVKM